MFIQKQDCYLKTVKYYFAIFTSSKFITEVQANVPDVPMY